VKNARRRPERRLQSISDRQQAGSAVEPPRRGKPHSRTATTAAIGTSITPRGQLDGVVCLRVHFRSRLRRHRPGAARSESIARAFRSLGRVLHAPLEAGSAGPPRTGIGAWPRSHGGAAVQRLGRSRCGVRAVRHGGRRIIRTTIASRTRRWRARTSNELRSVGVWTQDANTTTIQPGGGCNHASGADQLPRTASCCAARPFAADPGDENTRSPSRVRKHDREQEHVTKASIGPGGTPRQAPRAPALEHAALTPSDATMECRSSRAIWKRDQHERIRSGQQRRDGDDVPMNSGSLLERTYEKSVRSRCCADVGPVTCLSRIRRSVGWLTRLAVARSLARLW